MQHTFPIKLHNLSLFLIKLTWKQALKIIRIVRVFISAKFSLFLVLFNKLSANLDKIWNNGNEILFPNSKYFLMISLSSIGSTYPLYYNSKRLLTLKRKILLGYFHIAKSMNKTTVHQLFTLNTKLS